MMTKVQLVVEEKTFSSHEGISNGIDKLTIVDFKPPEKVLDNFT